MSLTAKLVLGFSFALLLQVVQMLLSGHYTTQMQSAVQGVTRSVEAGSAATESIEAMQQLNLELKMLGEEGTRIEAWRTAAVYWSEIQDKRALLDTTIQTLVLRPATVEAVHTTFRELEKEYAILGKLVVVAGAHGRKTADVALEDNTEAIRDQTGFVDEASTYALESLRGLQVEVKKLIASGLATEREVHDLPQRAALLITSIGVLLMAIFIVWYSGQVARPIKKAHDELEQRVSDRTANLNQVVGELEAEIEERHRLQAEREELHQQLVDASRQAGMAEIATGVLHNVGNLLNSANTSVGLLTEKMRESRVEKLDRLIHAVLEHLTDVPYFSDDPKGKLLPEILPRMTSHLEKWAESVSEEVFALATSVENLRDAVTIQQEVAKGGRGALVEVNLSELAERVLRMQFQSELKRQVVVTTDYADVPEVTTDRSKTSQIIGNLIGNAFDAVSSRGLGTSRIEIRVYCTSESVAFTIKDNGTGIAEEALAKVFAYGFTTKPDGHGFGLHHSANSATELHGSLTATSDGPGKGAEFTLLLPVAPAKVGA